MNTPPEPIHIAGTRKGEELAENKGREPGRDDGKHDRSARDSTGVNAKGRQPILPEMPNIPPS